MSSAADDEREGPGGGAAERPPGAPAAIGPAERVVRAALAALALVPVAAHALERGGSDLWLLFALCVAPAALGRRDPVRVLGATLLLVFTVPLLPTVLRVLPFVAERAVLLGAVAWTAVAVPWTPGREPSGVLRGLRWTVGLWGAWSVAAALRGFWGAIPEGSPWLATMLAELPAHLLVPRPQVEPNHAFAALALRLEFLVPLWFAAEVAARRPDAPARVTRWLGVALVGGLALFALDFWNGVDLRGESLLARLRAGLPRNHRPLMDNNALGTALVVALPVVGAAALSAWSAGGRRGRALAGWATALGVGAFLLLTSRSKAALGAAALAVPTVVLLRLGVGRLLRRPVAATLVGLGVVLVVGVQLLPPSVAERVAANRYGEDALRVLRLDAASDYLRANRLGPWTAAVNAGAAAPLAGHGLGSLPRRMEDFRDPGLETDFDPTSENAHNQWLQAFAEEGLVGAALLALPFLLAFAGAHRRLRLQRAADPSAAWRTAGFAAVPPALALNLQVGHSLLESSVAVWAGACLGVAAGLAPVAGAAAPVQGPRPGSARGSARAAARRRAIGVGLAVFALGLLPLATAGRTTRERASHGAYPWIPRPHTAPGADRLLSTDARWFVRWGAGERMVFSVLDPRPAMFTEPLVVTVELDGQPVLVDRRLPRPTDPAVLPEVLFKLDRPEGVGPGDLVELRVTTRPPFATTFYGDTGRDWIGPRVSAPAFIARR